MDLRSRLHQPTRRYDLPTLQDTFLVCAVATILVIRLQLWATNYPQLGGGKLHIAHLLWGGLLMLVAIGLLVSYMGRRVRLAGAVLGGIGFGFFIDELGKFITADNDYFFKPAAAFIYAIFVTLFFLTRWLRRRAGLTQREKVANAISLLEETAFADLDGHEKRNAIALLDEADQDDPLVGRLRAVIVELQALPAKQPGRASRAVGWIRHHYVELIQRPWFTRALCVVFILLAVVAALEVLILVFAVGNVLTGDSLRVVLDDAGDSINTLPFVNWANIASSLLANALVWIGVVRLRRSRMDAYKWFERALMVTILLTQPFVFIESQFGAVFGLGVSVLLLITVRSLSAGERRLQEAAGASLPPGPPAGPPATATDESPTAAPA